VTSGISLARTSHPDTHQKSVLAALDKERSLRVLTCSTEDDANAVAAGLYMTGEPGIVIIQHAGLNASVNTLQSRHFTKVSLSPVSICKRSRAAQASAASSSRAFRSAPPFAVRSSQPSGIGLA